MLEIEVPGSNIPELKQAGPINWASFSAAMDKNIKSGQLEREFGPQYSERGLKDLAEQFDRDVQELVPGSEYRCKERKESLEKWMKNLKMGPLEVENERIISSANYNIRQYELPQLTIENFLSSAFYDLNSGSVPFFYMKSPVSYESGVVSEGGVNVFSRVLLVNSKGEKRIEAKVSFTNPVLPVTQEEYLHAAHEISFGNVAGMEFLDSRISAASNHITHTSTTLDRVLSAAAAEMGPGEFSYWAKKADEVTANFKGKFVFQILAPWEQTPLGKEVNKRFRYPLVDYRELGANLIHLTLELEEFLFSQNGQLNTDNQALIDIISLQFGLQHKDLTLEMLDNIDTTFTSEKDYERVGRAVIEWGKKILGRYRGKKEERELVTHHTHIEAKLDESQFEYELPRKVAQLINKEMFIPTTAINVRSLVELIKKFRQERMKELLDASFQKETGRVIRPREETLKKYGLSAERFWVLVKKATLAFEGYQERASQTESLRRIFEGKNESVINFVDITDEPFNLIIDKKLTIKSYKK